jgi:hypothetical protein
VLKENPSFLLPPFSSSFLGYFRPAMTPMKFSSNNCVLSGEYLRLSLISPSKTRQGTSLFF